MKRIATLALVGVGTGLLSSPAVADGWTGGAFDGGPTLGLMLGMALADSAPPAPVYYAPPPGVYYASPADYAHYVHADHLAWCRAHYSSYDPQTDSFLAGDGMVYRCAGPF
jgi:hypothetical protein